MEPWDRERAWSLECDPKLTSEGLGSPKLLPGGALGVTGGCLGYTS